MNNIGGVCNSNRCNTSSEAASSLVDYYKKFVYVRDGLTNTEPDFTARGIPWALIGDSALMEFSVKRDGNYLIIVNNLNEADQSQVRKGAYRLLVTDYSADPPPDD